MLNTSAYRPYLDIGWEEYWVGFSGELVENMISSCLFNIYVPIFYIKNDLSIQSFFKEIISYGKDEKPGYQQIISGLILQILGQIQCSSKGKSITGKPIEDKISRARLIMNENINSTVDLKQIANDLNVSYSLFRKRFKEYTGISPLQYYMQLKIKHAQDLLLNTSSSIKIIASETGFENLFYFSKIFKKITGYSPSNFRKSEINV